MNKFNLIQERIKNAKQLDFGAIFNDAIQLYKKVWVQGLIMYLIVILITIPIVAMFYGPMYVELFNQMQTGNIDQEEINSFMYGNSPMFMFGYYLAMFAVGAITSLVYAGFYRLVKKIDNDEPYSTSDLFYFLSGKYFGKGFLLMLLTSIISMAAVLLCLFPVFYVIVPIAFMVIIFALNPELSISDILSLGFSLGNKKWGLTFALGLVSYICIFTLAIITCGIGILFISCFVFLPVYLIYKEVIGFDENDEINKIGQHQEI